MDRYMRYRVDLFLGNHNMHAILDNTWTFQFHLNYSVDNKTAKLKEKREKRTGWGKGSR